MKAKNLLPIGTICIVTQNVLTENHNRKKNLLESFIIIGCQENKILALPTTYNQPNSQEEQFSYYRIPHIGKYAINKDLYVDLTSPVSLEQSQIKDTIDQLDKEDTKNLLTRLSLINAKKPPVQKKGHKEVVTFEPKDIVCFNKKIYMILSQEEGIGYTCLLLHNNVSKQFPYHIEINGKDYYFHPTCIRIKEQFTNPAYRINYLEEKQLISFKERLKSMQEFERKRNQTGIGSLIKIENNLYLIFGEYKEEWLAFKIFKGIHYQYNLKINDVNYFPNFNEEITISKKEEVTPVDLATESEMQEMRKLKKSFRKVEASKQQQKEYKIQNSYYKPGDILSPYEGTTPEYVVIITQNGNVIVINKEDVETSDYQLTEMNEKHLKYGFYKKGKLSQKDIKKVLVDIQKISKGCINRERLNQLMLTLEQKNIK